MRLGMLKIRDSLITGVKEIYYHKLRSALTLAGIMLGVAALIAMMSIMNGFKQSFIEYLNAYGGFTRVSVENLSEDEISESGDLYKSKGLTVSDMKLLLDNHGDIMDVIVPIISLNRASIVRGNKSLHMWHGNACGSTPDYKEIDKLEVDKGRNILPLDDMSFSRVCVIGSIIQYELFEDYENPIGEKVSLNDVQFTVVGVFKHMSVKNAVSSKRISRHSKRGKDDEHKQKEEEIKKSLKKKNIKMPSRAIKLDKEIGGKQRLKGRDIWRKYGSDNLIWHKNLIFLVPFSTFQGLFREDRVIDSLEILLKDSDNIVDKVNIIKKTLIKSRNGVEDFTIKPFSEHFEEQGKQIKIMSSVFLIIAVIALVVGGIGIMNVILASISERIREIGIRKSVGARNVDIFVQFLIETIVLAIIGGILGVIAGVILAYWAAGYAEMRVVIPSYSIFLAVGVSSLVGILSGMYPSFKASYINPIDALRYE